MGLIRIRIWGQSLILPHFFLHSSGGKRQRSYGETLFPHFSIKRRSLQRSVDVNDKRRARLKVGRKYVCNDILNFATVHLGCFFSSVGFEAFSHRKDLAANWRVHLLGLFVVKCSNQTHWTHWSQEVFAKSSSGDQVGRVIVVGVVRTVLNLCFMWPLEFCGKDVQRIVFFSFSIQFSFSRLSEMRYLTTTGSLGESSYWIYVGPVMGQWQQDFEDTAASFFSVVSSIALLAWFSLVQLSMFDDMIFSERWSVLSFTIGSSAAKQPWSLCRSHRLLGSKDAMYRATVCERTCSWAGCSYSVPICRPSPQLGAERSGGSPAVLAAISETLHGEMEFVFGKGQSMPKSWKGTWGVIWSYEKFSQSMAIRIYNMCPFWLGPLECRIASLLDCTSLKRTQDRDHPPPEAFGQQHQSADVFVRSTTQVSRVAHMPLYSAEFSNLYHVYVGTEKLDLRTCGCLELHVPAVVSSLYWI